MVNESEVNGICEYENLSMEKQTKLLENKQIVHVFRLGFIFCASCYVFHFFLLLLLTPCYLSSEKSIVNMYDMFCYLGPLSSSQNIDAIALK